MVILFFYFYFAMMVLVQMGAIISISGFELSYIVYFRYFLLIMQGDPPQKKNP